MSAEVFLPREPHDTQVAAAESMSKGGAARARARVESALREAHKAGYDGLTDREIHEVTGLEYNTSRPRRVDLMDAGLVEDSGHRRLSERGRKMIVWAIKESKR